MSGGGERGEGEREGGELEGVVEVQRRLSGDELTEVRTLIDAATVADGVRPLNEHVMLHLRHGGDEDTRNLMARSDGELVGYAHLDVTDEVAGASLELVVHPMYRGRGHGRALVETAAVVADKAGSLRLRLWSHGSHPSARALAARLGMRRERSLWQMRRSLFAPIPDAVMPAGVTARTFRPGEDDAAWVELNARAFAEHPEQGEWAVVDLHRRMAESWFDPDGFFVATRVQAGRERLVGFHWTKVHGGHGPHGHDPIGEVYVVGVDPDERASGIGQALTILGLCHLRALGLPEAMLYVEEDNPAAIALYERLGFARWDTDVMYARD